jgi:hypothetical protein
MQNAGDSSSYLGGGYDASTPRVECYGQDCAVTVVSCTSCSTHNYSVYVPLCFGCSMIDAFNVFRSFGTHDGVLTGNKLVPPTGYAISLAVVCGPDPFPATRSCSPLSVNAAERPQTTLHSESFQAGYRGLGSGVPDNAHYRDIKRQAAQTSSCTVNY